MMVLFLPRGCMGYDVWGMMVPLIYFECLCTEKVDFRINLCTEKTDFRTISSQSSLPDSQVPLAVVVIDFYSWTKFGDFRFDERCW